MSLLAARKAAVVSQTHQTMHGDDSIFTRHAAPSPARLPVAETNVAACGTVLEKSP